MRTIEHLESDLHNTRGEHEQYEEAFVSVTKENRSLKRQLALVEGGSSTALLDIQNERDAAFESTNDLKRRLETAQKKARTQEEDAARTQKLWLQDKEKWEEEKRRLERVAHVAESRLKTVLAEVAAFEASHSKQKSEHESSKQGRDADNGHESDTGSIRTMSMTNSIRFSTMSTASALGNVKLNGLSLADELDFDDDESEQHTDHEGRESVMSTRHNRTNSRESMLSRTHFRNGSTDSLARPGSVAHGRLPYNQPVFVDGIMEVDETPQALKYEYVDTGVQPSPPPSPKLQASEPVSEPTTQLGGVPKLDLLDKSSSDSPVREWEIEANQRRKRVHAPPLVLEASQKNGMVSSAVQTIEGPLSPPRTPVSPTRAPPPPPVAEVLQKPMSSIATQTDDVQMPKRAPPPAPIPIPSIQLHPPQSAPATPRESILPQHSKDFGCQVSLPSFVEVRSTSVQTEEIRVDKRMHRLPAHLQPSAISSKPPSPEPVENYKRFSPIPGNLPPRNPRRVKSNQSLEPIIPSSPPAIPSQQAILDAYPGNNDDGPVTETHESVRRPHRISSLFAGFENGSSDEGENFVDAEMGDREWKTALTAPKFVTGPQRRVSTEARSTKDQIRSSEMPSQLPRKGVFRNEEVEENTDFGYAQVQQFPGRTSANPMSRQLDKPLTLITNDKPNQMRRAALIQSGVAAHQGRARSPSLPEPVKEPPFPIPTRASSRMPVTTASAPSDGRRSPTWGRGPGRMHYRSASIRKSRSAAVLPRGGGARAYRRHGSRSPPPMSVSTEAPESPTLPPMPSNEVTTPRYMKDTSSSRYRSHRTQPSTSNTAITTVTQNTVGSVGSSTQATSVVDAIAQTMVGEWMFKYVRRRKSFGVNENTQSEAETTNGQRHKRWVWLAPYERAVMWSSKQPTSGSALMGKSGRKCR